MAKPNKLYGDMLARMEQRNAKIRKLRAEGKTLEQLATLFGLSKQRVHQVVSDPSTEQPANARATA